MPPPALPHFQRAETHGGAHTLRAHAKESESTAIKAEIARTNPKYTGNHSAILTPRSRFHYVMAGTGKLLGRNMQLHESCERTFKTKDFKCKP